MSSRALVTVLVVALVACDSGGRTDGGELTESVFARVDTLVSTESGLIAHPTDMAIAPDGRIFLSDARANHVVVLTAEGSPLTTIGREGNGPGEFSRPSTLTVTRTALYVFDRGNSRVQKLSPEGVFTSSIPTPAEAAASTVFLREDGSLLVGSMGADSSLVLSFDVAGHLASRVGRPVVAPPTMYDFASMRERIAAGEIPSEFRNNALAAETVDGAIWVVLQTESEIRRYEPGSLLEHRIPVQHEQVNRIREDFFKRNAQNQNAAAVAPLQLFSDIVVFGDELWVLLRSADPDPAVVLTLEPSGRVTRRLVIPAGSGATAIAYDAAGDRVLLGTPDDAQVLSVPLGG